MDPSIGPNIRVAVLEAMAGGCAAPHRPRPKWPSRETLLDVLELCCGVAEGGRPDCKGAVRSPPRAPPARRR